MNYLPFFYPFLFSILKPFCPGFLIHIYHFLATASVDRVRPAGLSYLHTYTLTSDENISYELLTRIDTGGVIDHIVWGPGYDWRLSLWTLYGTYNAWLLSTEKGRMLGTNLNSGILALRSEHYGRLKLIITN